MTLPFSAFGWTFDGDALTDGQADYVVDISSIDVWPDSGGANFGYPPSVTQVSPKHNQSLAELSLNLPIYQTLVMTLPDNIVDRSYSLRCTVAQDTILSTASDTVTIVVGDGVLTAVIGFISYKLCEQSVSACVLPCYSHYDLPILV